MHFEFGTRPLRYPFVHTSLSSTMTIPNLLRLGIVLPVLLVVASVAAEAVNRHVGSGQTYQTLSAAADETNPGDTITIHGGVYPGGEYIENLQGTEEQWIVITNAPGE